MRAIWLLAFAFVGCGLTTAPQRRSKPTTTDASATAGEAGEAGAANVVEVCGAEARECQPGAGCVAGECLQPPRLLVAASECGSVSLALSRGTLYWTESRSNHVRAISGEGGDVTELGGGDTWFPTLLVATSDAVYWASAKEAVYSQQLPLNANQPQWRMDTPADEQLGAIAVWGKTLIGGVDSGLLLRDLERSEDPGVTEWPRIRGNLGGKATALAANDAWLAWSSPEGVEAVAQSKVDPTQDAMAFAVSASGASLPGITLAGNDVYWYGGTIKRAPLSGKVEPAEELFHMPANEVITSYAIADGMAYFGSKSGHVLQRLLTDRDAPQDDDVARRFDVLAVDQATPTAIVADSERLYWATQDCAIHSLALANR